MPLAQSAIINCFAGVGNYIAVFVRNKAFPLCGKTFFVTTPANLTSMHAKKNFSSEQCVVDSKNVNS